MKHMVILAMSLLFVSGVTAFAQHTHSHGKSGAKPVTLTGEIIDLTCFMQHPDNAVGMDHAKCAKACINKGLPVGFRAEDGTVFLLIGTDHEPIAEMVVAVAGKKSTITGTIIDHDGVKAIAISSTSSEAAAVYTCSMHPNVRLNAPGKCPECGINLERVRQ
jgi:heavy metal-binding protein